MLPGTFAVGAHKKACQHLMEALASPHFNQFSELSGIGTLKGAGGFRTKAEAILPLQGCYSHPGLGSQLQAWVDTLDFRALSF